MYIILSLCVCPFFVFQPKKLKKMFPLFFRFSAQKYFPPFFRFSSPTNLNFFSPRFFPFLGKQTEKYFGLFSVFQPPPPEWLDVLSTVEKSSGSILHRPARTCVFGKHFPCFFPFLGKQTEKNFGLFFPCFFRFWGSRREKISAFFSHVFSVFGEAD